MSIDPEIGRRHMLGTDGLAEQPNALHQYVRIIISQDWADSVPGQLIAESTAPRKVSHAAHAA